MNNSFYIYSLPSQQNRLQSLDRLLSIYSLLLIFIGTPCNLLCCIIYFQKSNRSNSIKTIFGYLAFLDTIVPFTFNLNYVIREFNVHVQITYFISNTAQIETNQSFSYDDSDNINAMIYKKNLEEYSIIICRYLSYFAFSILQTSSWVIAFGSLNRYLLIKKLRNFEFICKRRYTILICLCLTSFFFLSNLHILWMNGYRTPSGVIKCYTHRIYPNYMLWYQRLHLFTYCLLPSFILLIFNTLLMRIIFASKKRLDNHKRLVLFAATAATTLPNHRRRSFLVLQHDSASTLKRSNRNMPSKLLNRHSRKLTISLIFLTISYFTLTFPSTVIFSFVRPYIKSAGLRRTLSLLFTNLSTTTHVIRFFIYFSCSIDFRQDFYNLFVFQRLSRTKSTVKFKPQHRIRKSSR